MSSRQLSAGTDAALRSLGHAGNTLAPASVKRQHRNRLQQPAHSSSIEQLSQTVSFLELPVSPPSTTCELRSWQEQVQRPALLSG